MKNIFLILLLSPILLSAQTGELSSTFVQLEEVEVPPILPGCEEQTFDDCSLAKITSFLVENLDKEILQDLDAEESTVGLKFIIDSSGKVRRVMVRGNNDELKEECTRIIKTLPDFTPGKHEGKNVNVIVDIPIMLQAEEKEKAYDIPAMLVDCRESDEPRDCTSRLVKKYIDQNFNIERVKLKLGVLEEVVIHFIIDENGMVQNITAEGSNESFKAEGKRIAKKLPPFIPAIKDGKNIEVSYSLPIMMVKN